nr:immunoglobulin heavy chain junction region [Macaca mulatta]MOV55663.1 immunoglobulin heavy chain junction region [Macaca mulatta]MOV56187.1 immunoglobulin heavy chain junction region [Macaca mulatta]MOV57621.1 immunoglobulin heavy chain junction region [Macaca mulatta]MOV58205.1 immunoglobulin heavy chain junction region [Macaca mulatta]
CARGPAVDTVGTTDVGGAFDFW